MVASAFAIEGPWRAVLLGPTSASTWLSFLPRNCCSLLSLHIHSASTLHWCVLRSSFPPYMSHFQLFYSHNVSSFLRKIQSSLFECVNSESLHTVIRTKRSPKVGGYILSSRGIGFCFSLNDSFNLNQSWVVLAMEQEAAGGENRV